MIFPADQLVEIVTEKIYHNDPQLLEKYGEKGKQKCKEDNYHHFNHLKTSFELQNPQVFADYALWLNGILVKHGMKTQHLLDNFTFIEDALKEMESEDIKVTQSYLAYLKAGKEALERIK